MARNSSRTGVAIAALWVIVCASPSAPAQEWVRWQGTPSLLDQDPAKRLPAQTAPRDEAVQPATPTPTPATATATAEASAIAPVVPPAHAAPAPVALAPMPPAAPVDAVVPAPAASTPLAVAAVPPPRAPAPMVAPAPKRGSPAITMPAWSAVDTEAIGIAPLEIDELAAAQTPTGASAQPALAHAEPIAAAPRATGAYVTVGSDSDASLVAAAPQVYSCDDDGRCDQLQDEHAGVGLDAAVQAQLPPPQQIESQIKRNALRSF